MKVLGWRTPFSFQLCQNTAGREIDWRARFRSTSWDKSRVEGRQNSVQPSGWLWWVSDSWLIERGYLMRNANFVGLHPPPPRKPTPLDAPAGVAGDWAVCTWPTTNLLVVKCEAACGVRSKWERLNFMDLCQLRREHAGQLRNTVHCSPCHNCSPAHLVNSLNTLSALLTLSTP
jgi:hypothetical protein